MIAAFFHFGQPDTYARIAVSHARHWLKCPIVQLTDETTPALDGCEPIRLARGYEPIMVYRLRHLARLDGEVLSLGTDVVVQHDLSKVFDWPFDVALTERRSVIDADGFDIAKVMPFNSDVTFTRGMGFWRASLEWAEAHPGVDPWYVEQIAMAQVCRRFQTLYLSCDNFNHTPATEEEDVSSRFAVHYKGSRKAWMFRHGVLE